jgi:terpene synthase-like protein
MVNGYQVDDEDLANPDVRALIEMVSFIGSCDNDLFSWSKELSAGAGELNSINILAARHDGGLRHATEQVVGMRNCAMALFIELLGSVSKIASRDLRMHLHDLEIFISAWLEVQQSSVRYSVAEDLEISPAKLLSLACGVPEQSAHLSPIPTVAWWSDRVSRCGF